MHPRRPHLKRITVWTAAVALSLVGYVAGAPFVTGLAARKFPAAIPALTVAYSPLIWVSRHDDAFGHESWVSYVQWCDDSLSALVGP